MTILDEVRLDIAKGVLQLPRIPSKIAEIRSVMQDENKSIADIARAISLDTSVTLRVIQVANSAWYWSDTKVTSLNGAITRLGLRTINNLVLAFGVRDTFTSTDPDCHKFLNDAWSRSLDIATRCFVLAKRTSNLDKDTAFLSGLLHTVGYLPLVAKYVRPSNTLSWAKTLEYGRQHVCELNHLILTEWGLPQEIIRATSTHCMSNIESLSDVDLESPADYADLIIVAKYLDTLEQYTFDRLKSVQKLQLNLDMCTSMAPEWQTVRQSLA